MTVLMRRSFWYLMILTWYAVHNQLESIEGKVFPFTFIILEVTFELKKIQFFKRCQNDCCEVSQLYYSVSKPPQNFLYEIINSKREKKPTKIYENHKIGKLFLLCSLEGYGQHFMSRSLSTKTIVSSTWSFWYNIVLGEIGLIFEQICKRWGGHSKEGSNAKVGLTRIVIYLPLTTLLFLNPAK